jgi:hypothetical protein
MTPDAALVQLLDQHFFDHQQQSKFAERRGGYR